MQAIVKDCKRQYCIKCNGQYVCSVSGNDQIDLTPTQGEALFLTRKAAVGLMSMIDGPAPVWLVKVRRGA